MHPTRRQLLNLVTRAEHARQRNLAQRQQLLDAAAGMADHASKAAVELEAAATRGDPTALAQYRAAVFGRAQARRLLDDPDDD